MKKYWWLILLVVVLAWLVPSPLKNRELLGAVSGSVVQAAESANPVLTPAPTSTPAPKPAAKPAETIQPQTSDADYVLNKNTHKFHYPWCSSVDDMKEKNKWEYNGTREEVIEMGFVPCKRCNP